MYEETLKRIIRGNCIIKLVKSKLLSHDFKTLVYQSYFPVVTHTNLVTKRNIGKLIAFKRRVLYSNIKVNMIHRGDTNFRREKKKSIELQKLYNRPNIWHMVRKKEIFKTKHVVWEADGQLVERVFVSKINRK